MFIGERLKEARLNKKLTQEKLGQCLGVSKVSICSYEKGIMFPSLEIFESMVNILEVNPSFLLGSDNYIVSDTNSEYKVKLSNEDLKILSELKKYPKLYNRLYDDPAKAIEKISKDL